MYENRIFTIATDETLISMIRSARHRLVVVAPALSSPVAGALAVRFGDLDRLGIRVVLDIDADAYRRGLGEPEALRVIHNAADRSGIDLWHEPGLRLGVIVADEKAIVYSPVAWGFVEGLDAGRKLNAVFETGMLADRLARAAGLPEGAGPGERPGSTGSPGGGMGWPGATGGEGGGRAGEGGGGPGYGEPFPGSEIGGSPVPDIGGILGGLEEEGGPVPPNPQEEAFRKFTAFVELKMAGFRLESRKISLPEKFNSALTKEFEAYVSSRLKIPLQEIVPVRMEFSDAEGKAKADEVDDDWLALERKRIEECHTYLIQGYGRVILRADLPEFKSRIRWLERVVGEYQEKVRDELRRRESDFVHSFIKEYTSKWERNPPGDAAPPGGSHDWVDLEKNAKAMFEQMINFKKCKPSLVVKDVAPENIGDERFMKPLFAKMKERHVREHVLRLLFGPTVYPVL